MKKFGFLALLAAVLLVGCKPGETEVVVNSIKLNENAVTLALGNDIKLVANTDPAGATVTWVSSDPQVATVKQNGLVTAVAEGECTVTAKAGDKSASCKVTVNADAAYDYFEIADYGVFGLKEFEGAPTTGFRLTKGDSVLCVAKMGTVYAWDSNVQWVDGEGFVGEGIACHLGEVPFWVITENLTTPGYAVGYYLGEGGVFIYDIASTETGFGKPGHIDAETYGDFVQAQYSTEQEADFEKMQEKTNGALAALCTPDEGWEAWYGLYYAAINRLIVLDGEKEGDPLTVAADVTWCNYTADDRLYGFAVDMEVYEAEKKIQLITPYDYATVHKVYDEYDLFEQFENASETKEYKIGTHYMGQEMPKFNGKVKDPTKFHMAR